jgi:hypothetical protein
LGRFLHFCHDLGNSMKFFALNKESINDRFRFGFLHLVISVVVALFVTIPTIVWLYPSPFFEAAGGLKLFLIILAVDICIGPLLTFLVFDRKKKSLRFDLTVICGLQIAALVYGGYVIAMSRPVFLTYVVDRFETVNFADVDVDEFKKAPGSLKLPAWGKPELAFAQMPEDPEERSNLLFASLNGVDLNRMFRYYKPAEQALPLIVKRAQAIAELSKYNDSVRIKKQLSPFAIETVSFVPVMGSKRDLTAIVDSKTGRLISVVDLKPWADSK